MEPTIIFVGGGTGGHLFPGFAVADELIRHSIKCVFMGSGTPLEIEQTRKRGFEFRPLRLQRRGAGVLYAPVNLLQSALDVYETTRYFKRHSVSVVVGLGAASMIGPVVAAVASGVPTVLLEQNVVPGRATRFLSPFARETVLSWEETQKMLKRRRTLFLGNPVRREAKGRSRAEGAAYFGFDYKSLTLLVLGGSQGASSINNAFAESAEAWALEGLQIIHLTGETDRRVVEEKYSDCGVTAEVLSFCDEIGLAYAAADLVVSRAGGSAIAEIAANGRAAVLVPYPHAADRHQDFNAEAFARAGAAVVVTEGNGFPERLRETVAGILRDKQALSGMSSSSEAAAMNDAASRAASRIMEIVGCG